MLKRAYIGGSPKIIYESTSEHVLIQLWSVEYMNANTKSSQVYIHTNMTECDQAHGIPIAAQPIEVEVLPGETLYAISEDQSLIGMSIKFVGPVLKERSR